MGELKRKKNNCIKESTITLSLYQSVTLRVRITLITPTNGLGALEISLLFCYSFACNGLGALSCPFKITLKWVPFKICDSSSGYTGHHGDLPSLKFHTWGQSGYLRKIWIHVKILNEFHLSRTSFENGYSVEDTDTLVSFFFFKCLNYFIVLLNGRQLSLMFWNGTRYIKKRVHNFLLLHHHLR